VNRRDVRFALFLLRFLCVLLFKSFACRFAALSCRRNQAVRGMSVRGMEEGVLRMIPLTTIPLPSLLPFFNPDSKSGWKGLSLSVPSARRREPSGRALPFVSSPFPLRAPVQILCLPLCRPVLPDKSSRQGNVCQGNGRRRSKDDSPDNHSPAFSPAFF